MSQRQRHRGQHAHDPRLFSEPFLPALNAAVGDLSWMLSRRYPEQAALELVGNRYRLHQRQRRALLRASCTDASLALRAQSRIGRSQLAGRSLLIDGYNLLITMESALGGGIILHCRDGCYRDIASVHGTYRNVEETLPALTRIGQTLESLGIAGACWLLDSPISNSGRLRRLMLDLAAQHGFRWQVDLDSNPDKRIAEEPDAVAVSSDGWVLDRCAAWYNLHQDLIGSLPEVQVIRLPGTAPDLPLPAEAELPDPAGWELPEPEAD
ncbi:MAG: DUF434 domain-containing protein [Bacteroidia bacterium]|nr:DUF434 domain-containing protein [Bacteroidia bacterium]